MVPVKKKTKIAILIASLAVFALVLAAALLLSRGAGSDRVQSGEHPLRISEYMSANTAYPNADGRICDWIEIHNTSDKPFNVSGYRLSDDVTQAKYAFPVRTVIPADFFLGADYRSIIPGSMVAGAFFMLVADLISRTLNAPSETPIGLVFAIVGVPFFIWTARKEEKSVDDIPS